MTVNAFLDQTLANDQAGISTTKKRQQKENVQHHDGLALLMRENSATSYLRCTLRNENCSGMRWKEIKMRRDIITRIQLQGKLELGRQHMQNAYLLDIELIPLVFILGVCRGPLLQGCNRFVYDSSRPADILEGPCITLLGPEEPLHRPIIAALRIHSDLASSSTHTTPGLW